VSSDGWAPWLTTPVELPAKMGYLRFQPGFDDRPFALNYSLAALNIGVEHAIVHDPNAQYGQSAQQVIDNCSMLADYGVTDTWVNPPRSTTSTPTWTTCSGWPRKSSPKWDGRTHRHDGLRHTIQIVPTIDDGPTPRLLRSPYNRSQTT